MWQRRYVKKLSPELTRLAAAEPASTASASTTSGASALPAALAAPATSIWSTTTRREEPMADFAPTYPGEIRLTEFLDRWASLNTGQGNRCTGAADQRNRARQARNHRRHRATTFTRLGAKRHVLSSTCRRITTPKSCESSPLTSCNCRPYRVNRIYGDAFRSGDTPSALNVGRNRDHETVLASRTPLRLVARQRNPADVRSGVKWWQVQVLSARPRKEGFEAATLPYGLALWSALRTGAEAG
jgi:hypothetical protein